MVTVLSSFGWSDDYFKASLALKWWHCYSILWSEVMILLQLFWTEVMTLRKCLLNWSDDIVPAPFGLKWWCCYSALWTEVMILLQRSLDWSDDTVTAPLNWSDDIVTAPSQLKWHRYSNEQMDAACCHVLTGAVQPNSVTDHLKWS
jgi:hypothetical protein